MTTPVMKRHAFVAGVSIILIHEIILWVQQENIFVIVWWHYCYNTQIQFLHSNFSSMKMFVMIRSMSMKTPLLSKDKKLMQRTLI